MRRVFVAGVLVAGVALLVTGLFAQFGAGVLAPGFPQGIDGGGTQVGGRAVFLPGAESMARTHIPRSRAWLPGVGTGECEWTPPDVRMHAVRGDGSIVARRVIVSWRSRSGPSRIEAIVRHAPGSCVDRAAAPGVGVGAGRGRDSGDGRVGAGRDWAPSGAEPVRGGRVWPARPARGCAVPGVWSVGMTRKRRGRARVVVGLFVAALGAAMLALGLVAQWSSGASPVWARLVDGSLGFMATPDRAGPLAYMNLQIDPRPPDDQPRFVYVPGAGVVSWTAGPPTRVGLAGGFVYALREHGLDRVLLVRAPAWVVWAPAARCAMGLGGLFVRVGACAGRARRAGMTCEGFARAACPECGGERTTPA